MPLAMNISGPAPAASEERSVSGVAALDALIVEIAGRHYGLPAAHVCELLRAAAIAPAVEGPAVEGHAVEGHAVEGHAVEGPAVDVHPVEGLINLRGTVLPVFDLRALLHLPRKPAEPSDHFIAIDVDSWRAVMRVDRTIDLVRLAPEEMQRPCFGVPGSDCVTLLAKRPGELVPILDLAALTSGIQPPGKDSR